MSNVYAEAGFTVERWAAVRWGLVWIGEAR